MNHQPPADRNHVRDYWRSTIVNEIAKLGSHNIDTLQPLIAANKSAAKAIQLMIDDLEAQEERDGRTLGMHRGTIRHCEKISNTYGDLRRDLRPRPKSIDEDLFA